jgi:hypothetical protein
LPNTDVFCIRHGSGNWDGAGVDKTSVTENESMEEVHDRIGQKMTAHFQEEEIIGFHNLVSFDGTIASTLQKEEIITRPQPV